MTQKISINSAALNAEVLSQFAIDGATTTGLTFGYRAGRVNLTGLIPVDVAAGTVVLTDNTTNYVYLNGAIVTAATVQPTSAARMLYEIVTLAGAITSVTDLKGVLV